MSWLDLCVKLVAPFEGCHKRIGDMVAPYLDKLAKPPIWTRGYGRTYGITETSEAITVEQAKLELKAGLSNYGRKCLIYSPSLINKPECLAAITSRAWNCGVGAYKVSRLRKAIDEGRWADAAELMRKPDTAGGVVYRGLTRRREAERALFILGS